MSGKVLDDLYGIDFEKIYVSTYYGPYKIIKFLGRNYESKKIVRIKFLNTGYEYDTLLCAVNSLQVRDQTVKYEDRKITALPNTYEYDLIIEKILKDRWHGMMNRCYNKNNKKYYMYGALGVTVSSEWHNFINFKNDMPKIMNYDKFYLNPQNYNLDKDYLQRGVENSKKIYSLNTCIFLSVQDNSNMAIINKCGETNLRGVRLTEQGNYTVNIGYNGKQIYIGTYTNIIAAANEYNYYYLIYFPFQMVPLLNKVEFMPHQEAQKYLKTNHI